MKTQEQLRKNWSVNKDKGTPDYFAQHQNTPVDVLQEISQLDTVPERIRKTAQIRLHQLSRWAIPAPSTASHCREVEELWRKSKITGTVALSYRNLRPEFVRELYLSGVVHAAWHPRCPRDISEGNYGGTMQALFQTMEGSSALYELLKSPNCPEPWLDVTRYLGDGHHIPTVCEALVSNPNCPPETLARILDDDILYKKALGHPRCPDNLVRRFGSSAWVKENPRANPKPLSAKQDPKVLLEDARENPESVVWNLAATPEVIEAAWHTMLAKDKASDRLFQAFAEHPSTPEFILYHLVEVEDNTAVHETVLNRRDCPGRLLANRSRWTHPRMPAIPDGWHRHPCGGGLVENTANVHEAAYVGPFAKVSGESVIEKNGCVRDEAHVNASILRGNSVVGGRAEVWKSVLRGYSVAIDDVVLEETTLTGAAYVTGNTKLQGRILGVGNGTVMDRIEETQRKIKEEAVTDQRQGTLTEDGAESHMKKVIEEIERQMGIPVKVVSAPSDDLRNVMSLVQATAEYDARQETLGLVLSRVSTQYELRDAFENYTARDYRDLHWKDQVRLALQPNLPDSVRANLPDKLQDLSRRPITEFDDALQFLTREDFARDPGCPVSFQVECGSEEDILNNPGAAPAALWRLVRETRDVRVVEKVKEHPNCPDFIHRPLWNPCASGLDLLLAWKRKGTLPIQVYTAFHPAVSAPILVDMLANGTPAESVAAAMAVLRDDAVKLSFEDKQKFQEHMRARGNAWAIAVADHLPEVERIRLLREECNLYLHNPWLSQKQKDEAGYGLAEDLLANPWKATRGKPLSYREQRSLSVALMAEPEQLQDLYRLTSHAVVRRNIAANAAADASFLAKEVAQENPAAALKYNTNFPTDSLLELMSSDDQDVQYYAGQAWGKREKSFKDLEEKPESAILGFINGTTNTEFLRRLWEDNTTDFRESPKTHILLNPNCPPEVLRNAEDDYPTLVAVHANTPRDVLMRLTAEGVPEVHHNTNRPAGILGGKGGNARYYQDLLGVTKWHEGEQWDASSETIDELAQYAAAEMALRPNLGVSTMEKIAVRSPEGRLALAMNPKCPSLLRDYFEDKGGAALREAARIGRKADGDYQKCLELALESDQASQLAPLLLITLPTVDKEVIVKASKHSQLEVRSAAYFAAPDLYDREVEGDGENSNMLLFTTAGSPWVQPQTLAEYGLSIMGQGAPPELLEKAFEENPRMLLQHPRCPASLLIRAEGTEYEHLAVQTAYRQGIGESLFPSEEDMSEERLAGILSGTDSISFLRDHASKNPEAALGNPNTPGDLIEPLLVEFTTNTTDLKRASHLYLLAAEHANTSASTLRDISWNVGNDQTETLETILVHQNCTAEVAKAISEREVAASVKEKAQWFEGVKAAPFIDGIKLRFNMLSGKIASHHPYHKGLTTREVSSFLEALPAGNYPAGHLHPNAGSSDLVRFALNTANSPRDWTALAFHPNTPEEVQAAAREKLSPEMRSALLLVDRADSYEERLAFLANPKMPVEARRFATSVPWTPLEVLHSLDKDEDFETRLLSLANPSNHSWDPERPDKMTVFMDMIAEAESDVSKQEAFSSLVQGPTGSGHAVMLIAENGSEELVIRALKDAGRLHTLESIAAIRRRFPNVKLADWNLDIADVAGRWLRIASVEPTSEVRGPRGDSTTVEALLEEFDKLMADQPSPDPTLGPTPVKKAAEGDGMLSVIKGAALNSFVSHISKRLGVNTNPEKSVAAGAVNVALNEVLKTVPGLEGASSAAQNATLAELTTAKVENMMEKQ